MLCHDIHIYSCRLTCRVITLSWSATSSGELFRCSPCLYGGRMRGVTPHHHMQLYVMNSRMHTCAFCSLLRIVHAPLAYYLPLLYVPCMHALPCTYICIYVLLYFCFFAELTFSCAIVPSCHRRTLNQFHRELTSGQSTLSLINLLWCAAVWLLFIVRNLRV